MNKKFSLAVFTGPTDEDGKTNVIACGYSPDNKYGYMICKESRTKDGGYAYTDVTAFYVKKDEKTYQTVLNDFKQLFPPKTS